MKGKHSNPYGRRIRYRRKLRGRKDILRLLGKKKGMSLWRKRTKRPSRSKYRRTELMSSSRCDRRSFRYKSLPRGRKLLLCCPKGQWSSHARRCKVGTRGVSLLRPRGERRARTVLRPAFTWRAPRRKAANAGGVITESEARIILGEIHVALGAGYKAAIRRAWRTGQYDREGLGRWANRLQAIRNEYGPAWLAQATTLGSEAALRQLDIENADRGIEAAERQLERHAGGNPRSLRRRKANPRSRADGCYGLHQVRLMHRGSRMIWDGRRHVGFWSKRSRRYEWYEKEAGSNWWFPVAASRTVAEYAPRPVRFNRSLRRRKANPELTPSEVNAWLDKYIVPLLEEYGAREIARYPDAHLRAERGRTFDVMVIEKEGQRVHLHNNIHIGQVHTLLAYWERMMRAYRSLEHTTDPFHSDVHRALRDEFGAMRGPRTALVYDQLCDMIRASGRRLWT